MSSVSPSNIPVQAGIASKTGLVFDDRMIRHNCWWDPWHIEVPERYISCLKKIQEYNLIERCCILPSRSATKAEVCLVHTDKYINEIESSSRLTDSAELERFSSKYDSIYINPQTYECALLAAGSTLNLVSAVLKGSINNGLALVRPPGHHAMVQEACGFCVFNNIAIAAKYALDNFNLQRILIIDWDVHHGQGTQQIFYDDPRVLYFSIHRYESGEFWPHLRESQFDCVGGKSAEGFTLNVPLNGTGQGDAEYLAIFNNVLLPIAYEFCPELVLISAGYDAAVGCPEGNMEVTPQAFPHFLNSLSCLAGGRICIVLEGGYCLSSLSESVALTLRGLLGDPCPVISQCDGLKDVTVDSILNVISVQRSFWDAIKIQTTYDPGFDDNRSKHSVNTKYAGSPLEGMTIFDTRGTCPKQTPEVITANEAKIKELIQKTNLEVPSFRTGFVFDQGRSDFVCSIATHAQTSDHIVEFYKKLQGCGLLSKCTFVESLKPSEEEIALISVTGFANTIQSNINKSYGISEQLEKDFGSVELCQKDPISIFSACERLLQLTDAVARGVCMNGFGLICPPGHFLDNENTAGFQALNSAAVAAKYLVSQHKMTKILIIDLDIQCRSDAQKLFYEDNQVLYVSLHSDREYFPSSPEAREKQVGRGAGEGYTINIPFYHTLADGDYLAALFHIILPIAYEFSPQFVLLSLGYDDCTSHTRLSPSCFGVMTKLLSALCNGKIVLISEKNLGFENAPDTAAHCISALLGENCVPLRPMKPTTEGIETIRNVVKVLKNYWKCLVFDVEVPERLSSFELDKNCAASTKTIHKRRQSSDPVAIPKVQDEIVASFVLDFESAENDAFFCVTPLEYCPHLELLQPIPIEGLNPRAPCAACNDFSENWVCLHCYQVYCGRFINQHMVQHGMDMKHYLTLSYSDLSVWCYACDAYIHNNLLVPIKNHAHDQKFIMEH